MGTSLERWNIHTGDCLKELKKIEPESVQTVVTSPPYWGLRDYDVDGQVGLEKTPDEYVKNIVNIFRQVGRVLRTDGTVWLNLGDSYNGSGGDHKKGGKNDAGFQSNVMHGVQPKRLNNLKPKDLVGIPWRVAFALQEDGWYLRSDIIWHKPNPMPESVQDRPTKSHEYIFLLTKNPRYYYDADAIREPVSDVSLKRAEYGWDSDRPSTKNASMGGDGIHTKKMGERFVNPDGRNKRDVWSVNTKSFPEAHFATFPEKLIDTCIKAGTSEQGECPDCGKPWARVVDKQRLARPELPKDDPRYRPAVYNGAYGDINGKGDAGYTNRTTLGWQPDCKHKSDPVPQIVLDPFSGAGTTGVVACKLNRIYIGIELNPDYAEMSKNRLARTVGATEEQADDMESNAVQGSLL